MEQNKETEDTRPCARRSNSARWAHHLSTIPVTAMSASLGVAAPRRSVERWGWWHTTTGVAFADNRCPSGQHTNGAGSST
jgi:hypothetical protein